MTQTTPLAVTILSGGLDSTVLAYAEQQAGFRQQFLSFDYGQRHNKELVYAAATAVRLSSPWSRIDLTDVTQLLTGSSLTDRTVDVPEGRYDADTMKKTVVYNRNAMMLSIAYGVAVAQNALTLVFGAHAGDHAIYPDCRPEFVERLNETLNYGNRGFGNVDLTIIAPFIDMTKAEIVELGATLGVPFEKTWSCYNGGDIHCGKCGTCVERREAFHIAGVEDPTTYSCSWEETRKLLEQLV